MLQHTASYVNMLVALKHAATFVTLIIRQRTFICVTIRGVVTKEASQGMNRNWSCVCIARLRYAANLQACSLYERGPHDIVTQPYLPSVQSQAPPKKISTDISLFIAFPSHLSAVGRAGERHLFLSG